MILARAFNWPGRSRKTENNSVSPEITPAANLGDRTDIHSVWNTSGYPTGSLRVHGQNKDHLSVLAEDLPPDQNYRRGWK